MIVVRRCSRRMVEKNMGILMSQMQNLKKQVKSKGEIDSDDDERGEESQINVSVFYQRIGEYCSFRVTPEYICTIEP